MAEVDNTLSESSHQPRQKEKTPTPEFTFQDSQLEKQQKAIAKAIKFLESTKLTSQQLANTDTLQDVQFLDADDRETLEEKVLKQSEIVSEHLRKSISAAITFGHGIKLLRAQQLPAEWKKKCKPATGYSLAWADFFVKLYELATKYPKLALLQTNYRELSNQLFGIRLYFAQESNNDSVMQKWQ